MINWNFHTHSTYCDGKDTLRELTEKAIELGFDSLGFSGHSYTEFDLGCCMTPDGTKAYVEEIGRLKKEYSDRIKLFCGLEYDMFSKVDTELFDYIIGSVHYFKVGNEYLSFDMSPKVVLDAITKYFGGSFEAYAKAYFELEAGVVESTKCDIIGHFDLISKFNEALNFNETDKYLYAAESALDALVKYGKPFEINTGAMARGKRSVPYPSENILKMIYKKGGSITINSDCHDKNYLNFYFDGAVNLAKSIGFKTVKKFTENGFLDVEI